MEELIDYMYGSAEVVGLMMARIMGINREADFCARMLGRAMQYINFIRDIDEDGKLGYVQPIGAEPGEAWPDRTEVYGIGAFLLAGTELLELIERN